MEMIEIKNDMNYIIGKEVLLYNKIDSTQEEAKRIIKKVKDGTVIIANNQTNGQGTHGKKWYTEKNSNIIMSIILFPNIEVKKLKSITIDIANVIVDTIYELYNYKLTISYPNDIILNGKKMGGILTNLSTQGDIAKDIIIGIGLNINQLQFPKEISNIATSLRKEYNVIFNKEEIIKKICINMGKLYKKIKN